MGGPETAGLALVLSRPALLFPLLCMWNSTENMDLPVALLSYILGPFRMMLGPQTLLGHLIKWRNPLDSRGAFHQRQLRGYE